MEHAEQLNDLLGNIDIYLLDQIMKGRYGSDETILDAGCGRGRNLHWFISKGYKIYGIDQNQSAVKDLQLEYPLISNNIMVGDLRQMTYNKDNFDHVICNAVLHFAKDHDQFDMMFSELVRVLKSGGSLFIRMTSDIGLSNRIEESTTGVHQLTDHSTRYLITENKIHRLLKEYNLHQIEPIKSVIVEGKRSMTTLVLGKE